MRWNRFMRQSHRWLSIAFTLSVLANFAAMAVDAPEAQLAIGGLTLIPLFLLLCSGLYLFALPYLSKSAE